MYNTSSFFNTELLTEACWHVSSIWHSVQLAQNTMSMIPTQSYVISYGISIICLCTSSL